VNREPRNPVPNLPTSSNYILFSDVHLGADLVQHVRPWTLSKLKQIAKIDRDLCAMLEWYREHAEPGRPWKLVIAGDLVDFIGMSIAPAEGLEEELSEEERRLGLGSTFGQATAKMRAVATRHAQVFDRLSAFLAEGHHLIIIRGNHDVDFHWEGTRDAFVEAVIERAPEGDALRAAMAARIEFYPWFYYEEGLLYVEHGHQFDAMCNYHHLLSPVSPGDPKRISWSFSDILLRSVVRPTRGLFSEGSETRGLFGYLRLALSLGIMGALRLGYRYMVATLRALGRWRAHLSEAAHALREEHDRRLEELAGRMRLRVEKLRALSALWPTPVTRGLLAVLRSMFLDRLLLGVLSTLFVVLMLALSPIAIALPLVLIALLGTGLFFAWSGRMRPHDLQPAARMQRAASRIAELLPSRFVVMGHTHEPILAPMGDRTTYVNLGNWGSDEIDDTREGANDASRTHLVIRWIDDHPVAEFLRWIPGKGPRPHDEH